MADEVDGGAWLLEPPAPDEFSVIIRRGDDVELPDSVRTALEDLARTIEEAGLAAEVSGFAAAGCTVDCRTACLVKWGAASAGPGGGSAGGAAGQAGAGPARPAI